MDIMGGEKISVGPPYYRIWFGSVAAALALLVSFGPMLNWKRAQLADAARRLLWPFVAAMIALAGGALAFGLSGLLAATGIALGIFLIGGAFAVVALRVRLTDGLAAGVARAFRNTPRAILGLALAHAGLGVTAIGVTAVSAFQSSIVLAMKPGDSIMLAGERVTLAGLDVVRGPNYEANLAQFVVSGRFGKRKLYSERRFFPVSQTVTTLAGIGTGLFGNTYISIGDENASGGLVVRMWDHPFVDWIWGGVFLMAVGGMLSLSDRKVRIGVALPARAPAIAAAAS
jgi:cytochrome c-type biogenesis protein CcmF